MHAMVHTCSPCLQEFTPLESLLCEMIRNKSFEPLGMGRMLQAPVKTAMSQLVDSPFHAWSFG